MKIVTQILEDHQAKLTVEVAPERLESMKQRAARKIASKIKIPGFRPGKAPYAVIMRQIGEAAIIEDALELLVNDIYPEIIDEANINPYGPGTLENVESLDPPILEFLIPLEAEVQLGDYHNLRKPYEPETIKDEDVEEVLNNIRERNAVIEPVERPASVGDMVTVRVSAVRVQAGNVEDESLIEERSVPIIVKDGEDDHEGVDTRVEWPYEGFSQKLIGLSPDEEITFYYTYPNDAEQEAFRGAEAEFHVRMESVKARNIPELDDEFVHSLGEFENLDAFRAEIRTTLEEQALEAYNETYDEGILGEAIEQSTIVYPPQMLEREIDNVIGNLEDRLGQQGLDMDLYLKTRSMEMDELRVEVKPVAESRLKQTLLLLQIAKSEDIQINPEQVQTQAKTTLDYYSQIVSKKEARKLKTGNVYGNLVSNIMADMLISKSMERLRNICRGTIEDGIKSDEEDTEIEADTALNETTIGEPTDETNIQSEYLQVNVTEENSDPSQDSGEATDTTSADIEADSSSNIDEELTQ